MGAVVKVWCGEIHHDHHVSSVYNYKIFQSINHKYLFPHCWWIFTIKVDTEMWGDKARALITTDNVFKCSWYKWGHYQGTKWSETCPCSSSRSHEWRHKGNMKISTICTFVHRSVLKNCTTWFFSVFYFLFLLSIERHSLLTHIMLIGFQNQNWSANSRI